VCKIKKLPWGVVTFMLNRGANIILIKEQLGHDWLQSTEIYLNLFSQRIKSEYEVYKPAYI